MNKLKIAEIVVLAAGAVVAAAKSIIKLFGYFSKFKKEKTKAIAIM